MALAAKVKALQAQGVDVLNFTAGEPDAVVADHIRAAAAQAVAQNDSYYTATSGLVELKQAIVAKLERENNIQVSAEQVVVTNGAKEALYLAFQVLLNPGDEVIVPAPYWVSYGEQIRLAGGVPVVVETQAPFHITAELLRPHIGSKTKVVLLNSPSNPTGAVVERAEQERIAALATEHGATIISDEVYEHFVYDGRAHYSLGSHPTFADGVLTINSVSKTYAMTGWRVGYAAGPQEVISAMARLKSHLSSNDTNIAQRAAVAALEGGQEGVAAMVQEFARRRDALVSGVNRVAGCTLAVPEGAFYGFIECKGLMESIGVTNSVELCERLVDEARVAVVPGTAFGEQYGSYIRWSFAAPIEQIEEGVRRLKEFAEQ